MRKYERVIDGQVVETVQPLPGDYEDTRLGLLVLEGNPEWRLAEPAEPETTPPPAEPTNPPASPEQQAKEVNDGTDGASDGDTAQPERRSSRRR